MITKSSAFNYKNWYFPLEKDLLQPIGLRRTHTAKHFICMLTKRWQLGKCNVGRLSHASLSFDYLFKTKRPKSFLFFVTIVPLLLTRKIHVWRSFQNVALENKQIYYKRFPERFQYEQKKKTKQKKKKNKQKIPKKKKKPKKQKKKPRYINLETTNNM
mgnify:CR=1 FL=1